MRLIAAALALAATPALAEIVTVPSASDVDATVEKLSAAVEGAGAKVFAVVDHGSGAQSIGEDIGAMKLVIFGNPKIGTPAIKDNPEAGLVLPLKVLVYETPDGVVAAYETPAATLDTTGAPYVEAMTGALGKLVGAATSE